MVKMRPKSQFLNPRKSVRDIAASVVPKIAREKVDAHSASMLARIAGRLTAVVGIAGDRIKSARRLGSEGLAPRWSKRVSWPEQRLCFGRQFRVCNHNCCAVDRYVELYACTLLFVDISTDSRKCHRCRSPHTENRWEWNQNSILIGTDAPRHYIVPAPSGSPAVRLQQGPAGDILIVESHLN